MKIFNRTSLAAAMTAVAMFAGPTGCSDDDATPSNTVVDVAVENGSFDVLVAALVRAGLDDDLAAAGPFTVFAPTDAAFAAAGITLANVDSLPVADLQEILLYHVVSGSVASTAIPQKANALSGLTLWFTTGASVKVNDATVALADVGASNGVIHVIDKVLMPPSVADMAGYAGLTQLLAVVGAASSIPQGTALTPSAPLSIAAALDAPSVELTVFAPTNAAFTAIASTTATLTADQARDVLLYHVLGSTVTSAQLTNGNVGTLLALTGTDPELTIDVAGPSVEGACNASPSDIGPADIVATNGVIHVIDSVLLPIGCP